MCDQINVVDYMSATVELGRLVLSYPKAKLQLGLVASITASKSQDSIDLQQNSPKCNSNLFTSRSAWLCRGSGLHLLVQVNVDGQPLGKLESGILSRSLANADLWNQLHLRAALPINYPDTEHPSYKSGRIQLEISHTRIDSELEKKQSHRLSSGVPFADVKPPDGVSVLAVQTVCLSIEISGTRQPLRSKKAKYPIELGNRGEAEKDTIDLFQDDSYLRSLEELSQPCSWPGDTTLFIEQLDHTKAALTQLKNKDEVSDFTPNDFTRTSCPRKRSAGSTLHEVHSTVEQHSEFDFCQIMELLDAAVRMTICRNPLKISSGVKVKRSEFDARLAEFAPSLWSPDYLPAISQRACLAPIISHALCHSISKTRSLSLRTKIKKLATRGLRRSNVRPDISSNTFELFKNAEIINQSVAVELWAFLQFTLFDPSAARRLKPLWQAGGSVSGITESDQVLDEQTTPDVESCFEPYFESGDVLESADGYIDNDSDWELLMASAEDTWIPDPEVQRHGELHADFDYVHSANLQQNQGPAAGTLQHNNDVSELATRLLGSTCFDVPEGCAATNGYHDIIKSFEPLDHAIACLPYNSGMCGSDKQKDEDLLAEHVAKSWPLPYPYLTQGSADPTLRLEERSHDDAQVEDLILGG